MEFEVRIVILMFIAFLMMIGRNGPSPLRLSLFLGILFDILKWIFKWNLNKKNWSVL